MRITNMSDRFLIIDTAQRPGRVAVAHADAVVGSCLLEESRRHARDLAPLVKQLLAEQGWRPRCLSAVLVSLGPGSYTGLRVGIISAKTLAYATGCALLGIDTFAAIARQAPADVPIDVLADAQQGKVYVQRFLHGVGETLQIRPFVEWLEQTPPPTWVTGPGLELFASRIPSAVHQAPRDDWLPRPEHLLAQGLARWRRGEKDHPFALEPLYLRSSSAEELWARRSSSNPARS
jgi:tRNA threonylcarbamoyladenosine biosynthesis protein TsaB